MRSSQSVTQELPTNLKSASIKNNGAVLPHPQQFKSDRPVLRSSAVRRNSQLKASNHTEPVSNDKSYPKYLKLEDINLLIRIFAYSIQQRFEELDAIKSYHSTYQSSFSPPSDFQHDAEYFSLKFKDYRTNDATEIKSLEKMKTRVQQIIDFFKQRAKNGHLVEHSIKAFEDKITQLLKQDYVEVDTVLKMVISVAENGFTPSKSRPLTMNFRERRYSQRKMDASLLDHNNFLCQENSEQQHSLIRKPINQMKHRTISLSTKKKSRNQSRICQPQLPEQLNLIYSIIADIDIGYITKQLDSHKKSEHIQTNLQSKERIEKRLQRQLLRQNYTVSITIRQYGKECQKRKKKLEESLNPLKQITNKTKLQEMSAKQQSQMNPRLQEKMMPAHSLSINNWMTRKSKLRSHGQKKKKNLEIQNLE